MGEAIEYFFFSFINRIARFLSFRSAGSVGAFLGSAVFSLTSFRKSITLDNLRHAFPEKSDHEIGAIARGAFKNYGTALLESLWTNHQSVEMLTSKVRVTNPEIMARARSQQKGVLLLSAHFGSWELLPNSVRLNLGTPLGMIVQRQRNQRIDAAINASRSRFGNFTIPMGPSSRKVLTALAENFVVLVLGDQSGPKEAVFVDFFGRPAATHRGVAAFSLKTGAPIVMGFLVRQKGGTYTMTLEEVDRTGLDSPNNEDNIIELTKRHTAILERWIRNYPDHWLWMHKRWKHTEYFTQQQHYEEKEEA
jgi:KDO2-lipid IV(A) lauroyltransferase